MRYIIIILFAGFITACSEDSAQPDELFELKENKAIGFEFENTLSYTNDFNVYKYRNFYNGGGVSLGDVNNDGWIDIYMVTNQDSNRLYLNNGDWTFEDITKTAGASGGRAWSTGVSMVDINSDGWLDIYVCNSGDVEGDNKENELFINNGDLTFTEAAAEYGLNDKGFSTHASFLDYDKDGDLDAYLLNNSFQAIGSFNLRKNERPNRDELGGDKLLRNDNGVFTDVSEEAGIYGSVIGFGLGITIGDVNNDNWDDIFISNDFFERDYLYLNQQDGTFKEDLVNQIPSISGASMGADIADIDNDGNSDIFVTEMLPSDYERLKTVTTFESWDKYEYNVKNGYHHQYTRNVLHRNNGNNTFSDVARMAGVEASDWSWGALFFDMDNDGHKDLFIANGIYQDLTDQDYLQYVSNEAVMKSIIRDDGVNYKELIDIIPSNKIPNHAYRNLQNLQFEEYSNSGLLTPSFSNGSAYGDLDNDGDLDLVVNNVNMPSFIYENKSNLIGGNYLKLELSGSKGNSFAFGAKVFVSYDGETKVYEHQPIRGFQSSMDPRLNIGVGEALEVDVRIIWPLGGITNLVNVKSNQTLKLSEKESSGKAAMKTDDSNAVFTLVPSDASLDFQHKENRYIDFNREALNYHMLSTRGPCVSLADVNGDQKKDLIIPGPKGSETLVMTQNEQGSFSEKNQAALFKKFMDAEHVKCELFDADNDGDLDLYLASGGVEHSKFSEMLFDKLMINDGKGNFSDSKQKLPVESEILSTGAVAHGDFDGDGDQDLFVGERVKINEWGGVGAGYILLNDGKGNYSDATEKYCPELKNLGMITDAKFVDLDQDKKLDLVVIGEFMEVMIFKNTGSNFERVPGKEALKGWWNVMEFVDVDNDGDEDIVVGNHGLNSRFKASEAKPIKLYFSDFDKNGFPEGVLAHEREDGRYYPYALRHNLTTRMPMLKKKFPDFASFKNAAITDIFSEEQLAETNVQEVNELRSIVLINEGNFTFRKVALPINCQLSPIYAITSTDVNNDGFQDVILGGNLYNVQPEMGRYDASYGHVLINDGKGAFVDRAKEMGFSVKGEIRDFAIEGNKLMVFRNNDSALTFHINK